MKYCPFCGATLMGGAASFCAECGKAIPAPSQTQPNEPLDRHERILPGIDEQWEATATLDESIIYRDDESQSGRMKKTTTGRKKNKSRRSEPSPKKQRRMHKPTVDHQEGYDVVDDGYDGYYNDVRPMDNGHEKERMDPELIKKIIMVAGGAALVIILAIVMMLLL